MSDVTFLQGDIKRRLRARVDRAYRQKIRELVPTDMEVMGVRVPEIRALARAETPLDFATTVALTNALFAGRCREEMLFGICLLERQRKYFGNELWADVDRWLDAVEDWEICDQLAMRVAAPIVAKEPALVADLKRWAKSPNRWRRRFALATTTGLNQGGRSFPKETLEVCEHVVTDGEVIVQKAVGWALREACKHDEPAVFAFLERHRRSVRPRILREGSEKLTAAHRRALGDAK